MLLTLETVECHLQFGLQLVSKDTWILGVLVTLNEYNGARTIDKSTCIELLIFAGAG